ncbi:MAG TPA: PaaI family thioesterase [Pseudonocardiaceae bacterium]|nr:PaaI family thioesterase [Pseudonocardiaceae bacterium]
MPAPPAGFVPYRRTSPYLDLVGPIYESAGDPLRVGLWLREEHANSRGFVHAGLLVALADTVLGHTILRRFPDTPPIVTVSLNTDFTGSARPGTWLHGQAEVKRHGTRVSFANAVFHVADRLVLTASGVFVSQTAERN